MIRITTLLWIALLVVAGGTVMHVSYQVRRVERHIAELNRDTRQEQDAIRILGAEWDTLNDPHRIDELAQRHLTLVPTPIARVVSLDAIPLKPSEDQLARMAAGKAKSGQSPAAASSAAKPDDRAKALVTAQKGGAATIPAATPDGVGLILARAEAHR